MKTKSEIKTKFDSLQSLYKRLGNNLVEALESFIEEEGISCLNIHFRVKEFESFYEKIERKTYSDPFNDIEDICGIRIICYYVSDIQKIENIIKREFHVLEMEDKSESLGLKEFAYRSLHNIVQIKEAWASTPNYRGLQNLKAEVQIRTILMHAWAEIEHKLNYKSVSQVPSHFQRKLFRLSAKFEEADEQFEELRDGINLYRNSIIEKAKTENKFDVNQDFNKDSFSAFLNFHFPNMPIAKGLYLNSSFESYEKLNITFKDMESALQKAKPHFSEIIQDLKKSGYPNDVENLPSELLGFAIFLIGKDDLKKTVPEWSQVVEKWRKKIQ